MNREKFYITTPIYYGTAAPHLGSLYSTLLADVFARWQRLKGNPVNFLTGTDEHGQKVAIAAQQAGKKPQDFVDQFIPAYKDLWKQYELSYTKFIRTTDPEHKKAVEYWIELVKKRGDIYKSIYIGWYCTPCETYVAEKGADLEAPLCQQCGRETSAVSEECYFFRLSAYQDKLLTFYKQHPDFIIPRERFAEVIRFVQDGLRDLSISRTTITWGIPFPGDPEHVVYVWADALTNYISAIGYGDRRRIAEFDLWWPADIHVIGKDIVRFHAVFWPAFLMAANVLPPKQLLVHGWIKVGEQKMSKSFGNIVDPVFLLNRYGVDQIRYYLLRQFSITHDGQFNLEDIGQRISDDLANDLGNLVNRLLALVVKHAAEEILSPETWSDTSCTLKDLGINVIESYENFMHDRMIHQALATVWKYINASNAYFHTQEPWKLAKEHKKYFHEVLSATCHALYIIAVLLYPMMPHKMHQLLHALGHELKNQDHINDIKINSWNRSFRLKLIRPLFKKVVKEVIEEKEEVESTIISIDDVAKVELRVGTIIDCQHVPRSDKLFKLSVDFGEFGVRQILAGVKQHFSIDDLLGKQAVFVFNLVPRKMLDLESQGMMLIIKGSSGAALVIPSTEVVNGARLQ